MRAFSLGTDRTMALAAVCLLVAIAIFSLAVRVRRLASKALIRLGVVDLATCVLPGWFVLGALFMFAFPDVSAWGRIAFAAASAVLSTLIGISIKYRLDT